MKILKQCIVFIEIIIMYRHIGSGVLKLILNLAESYWFKIKKNKWANLQITLAEKNKFIDGIIRNDKKIKT